MRVHLLALPNVQTTAAYSLDGFCTRTRLFAKLLKDLGHTVILYGSEENDAPCDTFVSCLTKSEQQAMLGELPYQAYVPDVASPLCITFNSRAATRVRTTKQHGDVLATIGGSAQVTVWEQNPELLFLEYSIGYRGICFGASARVFQSHSWRHVVHGFTGVDGGRLYDAVIPPWFPVADFPYVSNPDPYVVYCGRVTEVKGITTACKAAEAAGVPLVVIGHGDPSLVTYGEFKGAVSDEARNQILAHATACLMPTGYLEPFGNVAAEAQLCGTPVIGPDYGAFVETIEQGVTGYRCTYLGEFVQAIHDCADLDRRVIRERAVRLYSEEAGRENYRQYFTRLEMLQREGWNSLTPVSANLALA